MRCWTVYAHGVALAAPRPAPSPALTLTLKQRHTTAQAAAGQAVRQLAAGSWSNNHSWLAVPQRAAVCSSRAAAVDELETTAAVAPAVDGGISIEDVSFEDGAYSVRGRLETAAPPDLVYAVLTDYASLARVFHNVVHSDVLDVAGQKHLVQTCKWAFLIFSGTFRTSLAVTEDAAARRLAFHLVQSSFMKTFVGRWEVLPSAPAAAAAADSGGSGDAAGAAGAGPAREQRQQGRCAARSVVQHGLTVRPAVAPPAAVAHYTSKIFVQQVENILKDLQAELNRRMEEQQ